jgi:hypothetical protein
MIGLVGLLSRAVQDEDLERLISKDWTKRNWLADDGVERISRARRGARFDAQD